VSKYSEYLESQYKSVRKLKDVTKDLIKSGGDIALKEFHDANSVQRLKEKILK